MGPRIKLSPPEYGTGDMSHTARDDLAHAPDHQDRALDLVVYELAVCGHLYLQRDAVCPPMNPATKKTKKKNEILWAHELS
jgi:hypothetical protein